MLKEERTEHKKSKNSLKNIGVKFLNESWASNCKIEETETIELIHSHDVTWMCSYRNNRNQSPRQHIWRDALPYNNNKVAFPTDLLIRRIDIFWEEYNQIRNLHQKKIEMRKEDRKKKEGWNTEGKAEIKTS